MTDVQVEENPRHIDAQDMTAIVAALEELGVEAEPTEQQMVLKAAWWVLVLHWLADDTSHLAFDSMLTALAGKVWKHYRNAGKEPPARIDVVDTNFSPIASREVHELGDVARPRLVVAAGRRLVDIPGPPGLAAGHQTVDDDRHAVELDDDGRPSSLTIAGESYPAHWLRLDQPWPGSSMGACPACWYEYVRRRDAED